MGFCEMMKILQKREKGKIIICNLGSFYVAIGKDAIILNVNVKSFCSFLAKKYVGFWQRNLEGEIPSFKSLL